MQSASILKLLHYYGVRGFVAKAWEKLMVDPKRFRGSQLGKAPSFPEHKAEPFPVKDTDAASQTDPISILYLVHYFFPEKLGGTERFVLNQAKEQQRRGNQVCVLTLTVDGAQKCKPVSEGMRAYSYSYQGVPVTAFCYDRTPLGLYYKRIEADDPVMEAFAAEQLALHKPSVVHCAYAQPMAAFLKVCRRMGIPYLITLTGYDSLCHYTTMLDKHGRLCGGSERGKRCARVCSTYGIADYEARWQAAREYLRGSATVTAPSAYVADVIAAEFDGQRVEVIPHGVVETRSKPHRISVRHFAFLGTLTELKGIPLLIRAFQKLSDPSCTLSIYGEGSSRYTNLLCRMAKQDSRIRLEGPLDPEGVHRAYEQADCVVVPSLVPETYNFVIREAAAHGCLVIGSRLGALPEAVRPGENGFLFAPGSTEDLFHALEQAVAFDWSRYVPMSFPRPREEAEQYDRLYRAAVQSAAGKRVLPE